MDKFVKLGQDMVLLWSKYKVMYWAGIWNTLKLAFLATLIGCFIGLLCGVLNTIPYTKKDPLPKRFLLKLLRIIIRIYVEVFRGTPMVLQSVFIYYGLPYFSNNALRFDNIFAAALLIVAINTGAYMAESVRGGIISIDPGQTEGAKAIVEGKGGFLRSKWCGSLECELAMKERAGVSSRCMPLVQSGTEGTCPVCGRKCTTDIYWGVAY